MSSKKIKTKQPPELPKTLIKRAIYFFIFIGLFMFFGSLATIHFKEPTPG